MDEEARPGNYLAVEDVVAYCTKAEGEVESSESKALSAFDRIC